MRSVSQSAQRTSFLRHEKLSTGPIQYIANVSGFIVSEARRKGHGSLTESVSRKGSAPPNLVNLKSQFLYTNNQADNTEFPSMKKIICHINQLTNRIIPNGPAQRRARHQASLPYSSTVVPSPYLIHPGSPNLVDFRSEDSSINHARPRIDDELTDRGRCTSSAPLTVTTADRVDVI